VPAIPTAKQRLLKSEDAFLFCYNCPVYKPLWQFVQTVLGIFRHPIPGTSIIPILPDGRIVLIRRRDNGRWALPGGIVDWGRYSTTVRRELAEETGLELVKIRRLVGVYSAPDRDPRIHSICILVEAEVQGKMKVQDTLEVTEIRLSPPHLYLRVSFPMTTISSCKTILTA